MENKMSSYEWARLQSVFFTGSRGNLIKQSEATTVVLDLDGWRGNRTLEEKISEEEFRDRLYSSTCMVINQNLGEK